MLNNLELKQVNERIALAKMCLLLFKEKCRIKSTNTLLSRFTVSAKEATELHMLQQKNMTTSLVETYIDTMNSRLGNCNEKSIVCYISLKRNPIVLMNHHLISLVELYAPGADHVFIVISDQKVLEHQVTDISTLSKTTVVLDSWTEDWFLPNITLFDSIKIESKIPTPKQFFMRKKVMNTPLIGYEFIRPII